MRVAEVAREVDCSVRTVKRVVAGQGKARRAEDSLVSVAM
jgi:hypothetical protein